MSRRGRGALRSALRAALLAGVLAGGAAWGGETPSWDAGWILGVGTTARLSRAQRPGGPAAGAWVRGGRTRLFGLPELAVQGLVAGVRPGSGAGWPVLEVRWDALAAPFYRDTRAGIELGWGRTTGVALGWERHSVVTGDGTVYARDTRRETRLRLRLRLARRVGGADARVQGEWVLGTPAARHEELGRAVVRAGRAAVGVAVGRGPDGTPAFTGEAWAGLPPVAVGWHLDPARGMVGPLLAWRRGPVLVRTSHLAHPRLGVTHRVELGFGNWAAVPW